MIMYICIKLLRVADQSIKKSPGGVHSKVIPPGAFFVSDVLQDNTFMKNELILICDFIVDFLQ